MAFVTAEALEQLINKSLEKAGIDLEKDHEATMELHKEIMDLCDKVAQEQKESKERAARQCMKAKDVSEDAKISISAAYKTIRELGKELESKGYLVSHGVISRVYFCERYYCEDEPHPFMDVKDVMGTLPVSKSEGYAKIRELNQILIERDHKVFSGRVSKKIFREKFYGIEVVDAG